MLGPHPRRGTDRLGSTGCRLIVLRYIGNLKVKEFGAYDLRRLPATKVSPEGPATTITIEMGATSRQVRFDSNEAEAIAAALSQLVGLRRPLRPGGTAKIAQHVAMQHGSAGIAGLANGVMSPGGTAEPSPHPQT